MSVIRDSSQPYVDKQETANHWKTSDKTQNGHRESEGSEKQSRAVQKSESKTLNGVSTSTVEEMSSEVTSKTLETSQDGLSKLGPFAPSLFHETGSLPNSMSNVAKPQAPSYIAEDVSSKTVSESQQHQKRLVDLPIGVRPNPNTESNIHVNNRSALQTNPYVDRQETFSQSKSSEETGTGYKETESREKKSDAVEYSVPQTPSTDVSKRVEERTLHSSLNSNEVSKEGRSQAPILTSCTPDQSSVSQNCGTTSKNNGSTAKTFLQSISNYLFSFNGAQPGTTSSLQPSETSGQQGDRPSNVLSSQQTQASSVGPRLQPQCRLSGMSEATGESRHGSEPQDRATSTENPNTAAGIKTTEDLPKASEMALTLNTRPPKALLRPSFSLDESLKTDTQNQENVGSTEKKTIPQTLTRLSSVDTSKPKVDFKTGLSFFQANASGNQSSPACFAPKPWAPVKPPVPVKAKVQTAPLQHDCSIIASETDEPRIASYPTVSSTRSSVGDVSLSSASSNPTLTPTSDIRGILTPRRTPETSADVTDKRQAQTNHRSPSGPSPFPGYGPVSSSPFPGRRAVSKPGAVQRANSLPSRGPSRPSGMNLPDGSKSQITSPVPSAASASTKFETAGQKHSQTLSKSSEAWKQPSQDSQPSKVSLIPRKVTSMPYVDQQETVSKSKMSEETDTGHRESETEETQKQSVQQSVSRTPTMSSSTKIEELSTHTVSQSNEVIHGAVPPRDQISLQRSSAWPTDTSHHSEQLSNISASLTSLPSEIPKGSSTKVQHQTRVLEEKAIKSSDESRIRSNLNVPSDTPKSSFSNAPAVAAQTNSPRNLMAPPPCVDKQETYSHSKISEKTDSGQRDSETSEKKRHSHEQSVSRTPTAVTSTTVDEQSIQTVSETKETSGHAGIPVSRSSSCGLPSDATKAVGVLQSTTQKSGGMKYVEQKSTQSMSSLSRESSEHQVKALSYLPKASYPNYQQQQEKNMQQEVESNAVLPTSACISGKNNSGNQGSAIVSQMQSHSQPFVDKQKTFSRSKISEKNETGTRETDLAEKNSRSFQQSLTRTPSMNSSTTTEEKCFQSTSQTYETSTDQQAFGENANLNMTTPAPHRVTYKTTNPQNSTPSAQKRTPSAMQQTHSIGERCRASREHVIPIQITTGEKSSSNTRTPHTQDNRDHPTQIRSTQQREHIIPVQLSPFPQRRAFLQEASAVRRYSVSDGWPGIDWGHPVLPSDWQTSEWGHGAHSAAWRSPDWARPGPVHQGGVWPAQDQHQPVFCCPVVGGPQAAALASLYAAPPLTGAPERGVSSGGGVSRSPSSGAATDSRRQGVTGY